MKKTFLMKKSNTVRRMVNFGPSEKAFTLIELLVVIAIIGLLSSVVMYSVGTAREKAFDTKRAQDIRQLEIAAQLRLLENIAIPTAAAIDSHQYAANPTEQPAENPSLTPSTLIKYLTMQPQVAEADATQYAAAKTYYDNLFNGGLFFKSGTTAPQDPQCVPAQPHTCYRAYYNQASNILVISTTLRTKKHTTGPNNNVQYGIAVGTVNDTTLAATCAAIGFPVYSTAQSASAAASCIIDPAGPSSIIQGISTGRNIGGGTGVVGSI